MADQISRKSAMPTDNRNYLRKGLRWMGTGLFLIALTAGTTLAALAVSVQLSGATKVAALIALGLAVAGALVLRFHRTRRAGWAAFIATLAIALIWYGSLRPSDDRAWASDVAHGVSGETNGDIVTLHNVRNFRWTDETHANEAWETRSYDLGKLATVDMFTSVWDSPDIAHLLVSFGFTDHQHVVFSVEIRKEQGEAFSTLGGFFRKFEKVLIAADEEDIVKLRTTYRKEYIGLYPLKLRPEMMRGIFMSYVSLGNELAAKPVFYNTVTGNCASTVYRIAEPITGKLPFDMRLLKTGGLPEYLDELGALDGNISMAERRKMATITARAQALPEGADFSVGIRTR